MIWRKPLIYEEFLVNDTRIKKLYGLYLHQSLFDKVLNILLFFAIFSAIILVVYQIFGTVDEQILTIINSVYVIILCIFGLELLRDYARTPSSRKFFKRHWFDIILVVFLSLYFLFVTYLGFITIKFFTPTKTFIAEIKNYRVIFNIFKR